MAAWAGAVAGGVVDFANGMMYLASRKGVMEAQKESRALYYEQRDDERKQLRINDDMAKRNLKLMRDGLSFDEDIFEEKKKDDLTTLDDKKNETSSIMRFNKASNVIDSTNMLRTRQSIASRF